MNWPNRLTLLRLLLTVGVVATLSMEFHPAKTLALLLFSAAAITDFLDGWIARKHSLVTPFGQLMDPLADKILMAAVFICLIPAIPAWVVIAIISREFLITGLRLLAAGQGTVLAAEKLGKHKTIWQIVTAVWMLLLLAWPEWIPIPLPGVVHILTDILIAVTVVLTLYSGMAYLARHRALLR